MNVGIVTFHCSDNYGALLQAYALSEKVRELGHSPCIIDYNPSAFRHSTGKTFEWRGLIGINKWLPHKKEVAGNPLVQWYIHRRSRFLKSRFAPGFMRFRSNHLDISRQKYSSLKELQNSPPDCDAYICGSDQVWNITPQGKFNEAYYLNFGKDDARRIAYAPSFGRNELPDETLPTLRNHLERYNHISVREPSGAEIVRKAMGLKAPVVLDPTLLLDDFDKVLVAPIIKKPYLLVYRLQQNYAMTVSLSKLIKRVAAAKRLEVINISPDRFRFWMEPGRPLYSDPCEWLGLMRNAAFVVTNSFHGTVFAAHFERPFLSTPRDAAVGKQNSRIVNALEILGLSSRYCSPDLLDAEYLNEKINEQINWSDKREKLKVAREFSESFLAEALS